MSYVIWDIETTTATYNRRKASPFLATNYVVASGHKRQGDTAPVCDYFGRQPPPADWFVKLLKGTKLLVGFNIKFDLLYALREPHNLAAWMRYVADGGTVWDCQLAEFLLRGMDKGAHMLALDELAPAYGGNAKIDEVKALWAAGMDTPDIARELLERYLVGGEDGVGDIGNTGLVFLGQLDKARASGQLRSIMLNMGSLLCTVEMERNGMCVDKPRALTIADGLRAQLETARSELDGYLPEDLPFTFNWGSRHHLSPLIFGGDVSYDAMEPVHDASGQPVYHTREEVHYLLAEGGTLSQQAYLYQCASQGDGPELLRWRAGRNAGEPRTKRVKVPDLARGQKTRKVSRVYRFAGYTKPRREWATATPGIWQVGAEVIAALADRRIPFLQKLADVARTLKDLSTYYLTTDPKTGVEKGMLTLVGDDGLIHHRINHTSTVTGRFSSSDPNLQNIPKEGKSEIKSVFVSRFRKGNILQSDFSALEVYVQAILTDCKQLIADLRDGLDMHCARVAQKEGISYADAYLRCKGDRARGIAPLPEWERKRTEAKAFSFQRAYGAGARKIAGTTGMTSEDVEALIESENARYPELAAYNTAKMARIKKSGKPTGSVYPHPDAPGLACNPRRGVSVTPDGKIYSYTESPTPAFALRRGAHPTSYSPTEVANYEIQGMGAEWVNAAMWLAVRSFYARGNFGAQALLVNQVHDAIYVDAHDACTEAAAALLHACMCAASEFMAYWFNWQVPLPIPSETVWGRSMIEEEPFGGLVISEAKRLRTQLRQQYMNGYEPDFEKDKDGV